MYRNLSHCISKFFQIFLASDSSKYVYLIDNVAKWDLLILQKVDCLMMAILLTVGWVLAVI